MMVYVFRTISKPGMINNRSFRIRALLVWNIIIAFVWLFFGIDFTIEADTAKKSTPSAGQNDKGIDFK
jgi:hypothetical protein